MAFNKINVIVMQKIQEKIMPNQLIHYMKIIRDAGCWLPVTGYWFPDAGRVMLDARLWQRVFYCQHPASSIQHLASPCYSFKRPLKKIATLLFCNLRP